MLPAARDAIAAVDADPRAAIKLVVTGGVGTGKSTVLTAIRESLRSSGRQVLTRAPRSGGSQDAVVIDDAEFLPDDELDRLTDLVAEPTSTVVVAAMPLTHRPSLRALITALERENPPIGLGPLPAPEVGRSATAALGAPASADMIRLVVAATGGFPFLLDRALSAMGDGSAAMGRAARFGLLDRLSRIDDVVLDTLLVMSLGVGLGPDDVAAALDLSPQAALAAVDGARASALADPSLPRLFLQAVHDGVAHTRGTARHHEIEISLLRSQLQLSTLTPELALRLAEHGVRDDGLSSALADFAGHNRAHPARAARLYRAAADAGATAANAELADALALTGDCATAARLADDLLASPDPGQRAAAVRIAASIALHDGAAVQGSELFRWLGPSTDAVVTAAATITSLAVGDTTAARAAAGVEHSGPPTSLARTARSVSDGLVSTLDEPYAAAMARLGRALGGDGLPAVVLPDTPAALVTLVALHGGDAVRARSVIGRTVSGDGETDRADAIFVTVRHRLLLGWTQMQDGQLSAAAATFPADGYATLHRRDALWATALHTGIARRSGDTGAMQKHWYAAMDVLAESSVDLFALLPLGELWVAAARMRQVERLQHALDEAFGLLSTLGNPVLWSVPLHWAGVHAGILANAPDAVAPHGQALTAAAPTSAFAKALAIAGRAWLRVLAGNVEVAEVTASARGLVLHGHAWEATRLAGQAALQTSDPRVSASMLQLARDLKQSTPDVPTAGPVDDVTPVRQAAAASAKTASAALSDREREVAELLVQGMPYREIGSQLFISAKTVEHHVARIRRRLGAQSRSEMLSMLRAQLDGAARR